MNEFTKEELESLIGAFNWIHEDPSYRTPGGWDKDLENKIQTMIDNYDEPCTHKNSRRVSLLDGHVYDICTNCEYIRQMR